GDECRPAGASRARPRCAHPAAGGDRSDGPHQGHRRGGMMIGLAARLKGLQRAAVLTAIALVALFALWSVLAPISSATVATGIVSPDTGRKTVQHLEGGIVERILVAEGDVVAEGQPLVVLVDAK